ncbi:MAG: PIN/TRAM domain-containing protein [Bacillota bacterium]
MKKFFTIFVTAWVTVGTFAGSYYLCQGHNMDPYVMWSAIIAATLLACFVSAWWMPVITDAVRQKATTFSKMPAVDIISGALGLVFGLIVAALLNSLLSEIPVIGTYISIFTFVVFGYVCSLVGYKKRSEIAAWLHVSGRKEKHIQTESAKEIGVNTANPKVLDTSVIIDGRINDICQTGFIEGQMVIPNFVLDELRHISDSSDLLRRNRGRRGLDILHRLQKDFPGKVVVTDRDYQDIAEVDSKLLQLAKDLEGMVITNDYNLNKVAQVQGVTVLNINELSNALKPVVLPGERMTVEVIREGKEQNQGLAYLDDGTMIVIENGKKYIGQTIDVEVSSVLQTSAGRMIFVRYYRK